MTNPVVLLGTQSNGETLPVQVDDFGRLVAEGLQGIEGPPGPPGIGQLPPDPYEGALLGWLNGELAWVGTPPVPIPEGVFGPITAWNRESGLITVEGGIPLDVANGVYIYQCDENGDYVTEGWDVRREWSDLVTCVAYDSRGCNGGGQDVSCLFQGNGHGGDYGGAICPASGNLANFDLTSIGEIQTIRMHGYCNNNNAVIINGNYPSYPSLSYKNQNILATVERSDNTMAWSNNASGEGEYIFMQEILIDEVPLVNRSVSINMRVNQTFDNNIIGVASTTKKEFTVGRYLKVPEQQVAAWVLYGNDPTSLIDHLRSS